MAKIKQTETRKESVHKRTKQGGRAAGQNRSTPSGSASRSTRSFRDSCTRHTGR